MRLLYTTRPLTYICVFNMFICSYQSLDVSEKKPQVIINLWPNMKKFLHTGTRIIRSECHVWWILRMWWNNHSSCLRHIGPSSACSKVLLTRLYHTRIRKINIKLNLSRYKPRARMWRREIYVYSLILTVGIRRKCLNFNTPGVLLLGKGTRSIEQENEWAPPPVWTPGKS